VANFSWFIGAFLAAGSYRWIARNDRVENSDTLTQVITVHQE
jgi:NCS1 family nucleobase:cation symporter-1